MKKIMIAGAVLALLAGSAMNAGAQEAKDVLAKMIAAQGGTKALEAIKDAAISGTLEMLQMGMNGTITITKKDPAMIRIDIEIAGMLISQGYDGTKGWLINPQTGTTDMPELQEKSMRRQALGPQATLHPEKFGITHELKGREKVGEKDCYVLLQSFKDGHSATIYVDAATGLIAKVRSKTLDSTGSGQEVESESIYDDYRNEHGLMFAHKMTTSQNGAPIMEMTYTSVSVNANPPDSFFKMK
jgi:outer membrane lipoprotein-sorting protein